jgi:hypothetical protein
MDSPFIRAAIVAGLTYAAYRWLPLGVVGKTITLAVGGVSVVGVLAPAVPLLGNALNGRLPMVSA